MVIGSEILIIIIDEVLQTLGFPGLRNMIMSFLLKRLFEEAILQVILTLEMNQKTTRFNCY